MKNERKTRVGNNGNGGKKGRSGRKPKEATILKRRIIENKIAEADASFAFLVEVRDTTGEKMELRLRAAVEILDRVLGKAAQMTPPDKDDELYKAHLARIKQVIFTDDDKLDAAAAVKTDQHAGDSVSAPAATAPSP